MKSYKEVRTLSERMTESAHIRKKYPDRIPVIIQRKPYSKAPLVSKYKYLVNNDLTVSQLLYSIRSKIKLDVTQALFFFVEQTIPVSSHTMFHVYHSHKDPDGFLYLIYDTENTFG